MTARWVERWANGRIEVRPWQTFPPRMVEAGLTGQDGEEQAWLVTPAGQVKGGAAAINEALKSIWWARGVTWFYPLPGIRQLEDAVYGWVAANRYRFPGITPACQAGAHCRDEAP